MTVRATRWVLPLAFTVLAALVGAEAGAAPLWIGTITTDAGLVGLITVANPPANTGGHNDCGSGVASRLRCLGPACPARRGDYGEDNGVMSRYPSTRVFAAFDFPVKDEPGVSLACAFQEVVPPGLACTRPRSLSLLPYGDHTAGRHHRPRGQAPVLPALEQVGRQSR